MIAVVASSAIRPFPDITFFPQLIIFLVMVLVVKKWILEPTLLILRRRYELTEGALLQAKLFQEEGERLREKMNQRLLTERNTTAAKEEAKRRETEAKVRSMIAEARVRSNEVFEKERSHFAVLAKETLIQLEKEILPIADLIVEQVMPQKR